MSITLVIHNEMVHFYGLLQNNVGSGEIATRGVGQMRLIPLVKVNDTHVLGSGELGCHNTVMSPFVSI